jgi:hypothetical protein
MQDGAGDGFLAIPSMFVEATAPELLCSPKCSKIMAVRTGPMEIGMDEWDLEDEWEWDEEEIEQYRLHVLTDGLSGRFFLSDNDFLPDAGEDYDLGFLGPVDWFPLVNQLDELLDLEVLVDVADALAPLLQLDGLPTELLEAPLRFLGSALEGNLPREPSGRPAGSRKLVKIALLVVRLMQALPETAQAAVRAWADVHRASLVTYDDEELGEEDLADLLFAPDMPPIMTGFSMMIALTLMRWPERAEGLPLPPGFADPDLFEEVLENWEVLPDSPAVTEQGAGEAEALFAQGQLAHTLAQMGSVEVMAFDEMEELGDEDRALAYSRLSRSILWVHNQCRHCPEREDVACKVATDWPERPVPLLDVAGEVASTGRIAGCVRM